MSKRIRITVGSVMMEATLLDNATADAIYETLPLDVPYNVWGDEFYFDIPVHMDLEGKGQRIMEIGDLAYWPPGHAFCIFFGATPASTDERPRAASEVQLFGKIDGDATELCNADEDTIQVERVETIS